MLLGVIYENDYINEVKYKPRNLMNEKLLQEFNEKVEEFESKGRDEKGLDKFLDDLTHTHELKVKCW